MSEGRLDVAKYLVEVGGKELLLKSKNVGIDSCMCVCVCLLHGSHWFLHVYIHIYTHTYICIYVYIYEYMYMCMLSINTGDALNSLPDVSHVREIKP